MTHTKTTAHRHPNCRCVLLPIGKTVDEDWCKFAAGIMLCDISKKIIIPSYDEWIGLGLLERDDGLRRMN